MMATKIYTVQMANSTQSVKLVQQGNMQQGNMQQGKLNIHCNINAIRKTICQIHAVQTGRQQTDRINTTVCTCIVKA